LAVEYGRHAQNLWRELTRHSRAHHCGFGEPGYCPIYATLQPAWLEAIRMAEALDWLVFGKYPEMDEHRKAWAEFLTLPTEET
jgi:hypothetical protein